jgi:hypothetical protein
MAATLDDPSDGTGPWDELMRSAETPPPLEDGPPLAGHLFATVGLVAAVAAVLIVWLAMAAFLVLAVTAGALVLAFP